MSKHKKNPNSIKCDSKIWFLCAIKYGYPSPRTKLNFSKLKVMYISPLRSSVNVPVPFSVTSVYIFAYILFSGYTNLFLKGTLQRLLYSPLKMLSLCNRSNVRPRVEMTTPSQLYLLLLLFIRSFIHFQGVVCYRPAAAATLLKGLVSLCMIFPCFSSLGVV